MCKQVEFEFLVRTTDGTERVETWTGSSMESAATRMLDCLFDGNASVIAWRYPSYIVTTVPIRNC